MDKIEKAKDTLRKEGYILGGLFHIDDIEIYAKENFSISLEKEELNEILENINRHFNAEIGINWDVIETEIGNYLYSEYEQE